LHPIRIIPYENLYPLGTLKEKIHETDENILFKRVEETTPDGKVILSYNESSNSFLYWAEKTITYKYLEVLARKYVILYDCKEIYVNIFKELLKAMDTPEIVQQGPFVSFKPYNTISRNIHKKIANENANVYKYMGKTIEQPVKNTYKPISFLDYKKQVYE